MESCVGSLNLSLNGAAHTIPNHVSNNVPLLKGNSSQPGLAIFVANKGGSNQPTLVSQNVGNHGAGDKIQIRKQDFNSAPACLSATHLGCRVPNRRQANTHVIHLWGSGPSIHQSNRWQMPSLAAKHTTEVTMSLH